MVSRESKNLHFQIYFVILRIFVFLSLVSFAEFVVTIKKYFICFCRPNLVPTVQFTNLEKHPRSDNFRKVAHFSFSWNIYKMSIIVIRTSYFFLEIKATPFYHKYRLNFQWMNKFSEPKVIDEKKLQW